MAFRAHSQCRQTLGRVPPSTAPTLWITDRMLFEAFRRYSLSSVHSTGADARCVHFNAGPLEHRRRAGKRRMTAVLPVSRLELPTWLLSIAQDNSPPTWFPPSKPTERHRTPGLLNRVISWLESWLEDYPPDTPFITPPADATDEVIDPTRHMAKMQDELFSTAEEFKAKRAVLDKYYDDFVPCIASLARAQTDSGIQNKADREILRCLLDPYAGQEDLMENADLGVVGRALAYWQARVIRTFSAITRDDPHLHRAGIWIEISALLCNPKLFQMQTQKGTALAAEKERTTSSISSEPFYSWCSTLKQLAIAIRALPGCEQVRTFEAMERVLTTHHTETARAFDARWSWAAVLLWRQTHEGLRAFQSIYNRHLSDEPEDVRDERNWYIILADFVLSHPFGRSDFNAIYAYSHSASRWPALFAALIDQGERSSRLLRRTYRLLEQLNYVDEVAAAVRAETNPALQRGVEGLVIATADYRTALRLHDSKTVVDSRSTPKNVRQWSYNTWAHYVHSMIRDSKVPLTDITATIGSISDCNIVDGVSLPQEERDGRARLLEEMSHTLAYSAHKVRPWRVWKELSLWNQLHKKFTGRYSAEISQIMLDIVIARLKRGEVLSDRRLSLMVHIVREQAGQEQAQAFGVTIRRWRNRNRFLGTDQQRFPLRFRPDYSRAEMAALTGDASTDAETSYAKVAQLVADASNVSQIHLEKDMAQADVSEFNARAEKINAAWDAFDQRGRVTTVESLGRSRRASQGA